MSASFVVFEGVKSRPEPITCKTPCMRLNKHEVSLRSEVMTQMYKDYLLIDSITDLLISASLGMSTLMTALS